MMAGDKEIEQLLRDSFPRIGGEFIDDGPSGNLCSRYRLKDGSLQVLLEQHAYGGHWEAMLYDYAWTLEAEEGSTPGEAVSNLQVAIAQIGAINAAANELAVEPRTLKLYTVTASDVHDQWTSRPYTSMAEAEAVLSDIENSYMSSGIKEYEVTLPGANP